MAQTRIKLNLQVGSQQIERVFEQDAVLIGAYSADLEGLSLDLTSLLPEHTRIFAKDGVFHVHNLANDPFVTLNGMPFGKKKIVTGDRLAVGEVEILFEGQTAPAPQRRGSFSNSQQKQQKQPVVSVRRHEPIVEEDEDLEALIREVESFEAKEASAKGAEEPKERHFKASPLHGSLAEAHTRVGLETIQHSVDRIIGEGISGTFQTHPPFKSKRAAKTSETPQVVKNHFASVQSPPTSFWRPLIVIAVVLFAIMAAIGSGIYFTFSEKGDEQEYVASQGLSDMAMALTYAQIHQLKPPNLNWGDPDFVREALTNVLPPDYPSLAVLDKQGSFANSPYMVRVYTSTDLSQFLLIAQPEASLWQWLLSRETIVLDSRSMELHKTTDLRALNRLLANSKPLEGANALEISHLVSQASLVRLSSLASETGLREFLPPKGLNKLSPGGEIRVYNALRYYRLTAPVMEAVGALASSTQEPQEEALRDLQKRVAELVKMPNIILYTTTPESVTFKALELLKQWYPEHMPVIAQLTVEKDGGGVQSSHLILDQKDLSGEGPSQEGPIALAESDIPLAEAEWTPMQNELRAVLDRRLTALTAYKDRLVNLLDEQIAAPKFDFGPVADQLILEMEDMDLAEQVEIRQTIVDTYRTYVLEDKTLSHEAYVAEATAAGMHNFLPAEFFNEAVSEENPSLVAEQINQSIDHTLDFGVVLHQVQQANDLSSLEEAIASANRELASEPLSNDDRLQALRNKLQVHVAHRLEQLILGSSSPLPDSAYNRHNRARIQSILMNVGIEDSEQRDYYLHEFDLIVQRKALLQEE